MNRRIVRGHHAGVAACIQGLERMQAEAADVAERSHWLPGVGGGDRLRRISMTCSPCFRHDGR